MDLDKLKNGDKIKIGSASFEVLYVQEECDYNLKKEPTTRRYLAIYLHDNKSKSLAPTHLINYYYDSKEIFLIEIQGKKITQKDIILKSSAD